MKLLRVPRERAEEVRKILFSMNAVRKDRKIFESDEYVFLPLKDDVEISEVKVHGFDVVEGESSTRVPFRSPIERIRAEVDLPASLKGFLPDKWEKIGDVLIMRFPPQLSAHKEEIAKVYARVLNTKTVCEETGKISGIFREPQLRIVWGSDTETIHKENGIFYKLDVARLMFSSGNISERIRMGGEDCSGQLVVDMFAGIGYFTLPVAVHGGAERVIACEINPIALHYLKENIRLNGVEEKVEIFPHDNRLLEISGEADRVIMGYVGKTRNYLKKAFEIARSGAVVHYHDTFPSNKKELAIRALKEEVGEDRFDIIDIREVKSYAPGISHFVVDVVVR